MTTYQVGSHRFFSTLEECRAAGKPQGKESWEIIEISGFDKEGKPLTVFGWTGGAAVLGWQVATHFGWSARKAEGKRGGDSAALVAERQKTASLEAQLEALKAQLEAQSANNQQPAEEPKPRSRKS